MGVQSLDPDNLLLHARFLSSEQPKISACQIDHVLFSYTLGGVSIIIIQHLKSSSGSVGGFVEVISHFGVACPCSSVQVLRKSKTFETLTAAYSYEYQPQEPDDIKFTSKDSALLSREPTP